MNLIHLPWMSNLRSEVLNSSVTLRWVVEIKLSKFAIKLILLNLKVTWSQIDEEIEDDDLTLRMTLRED